MNNEMCVVCSAVRVYLVDILNTNLQSTFEKLIDLDVNNESHYLCYICNRRLHQCYELQQLAINKNEINLPNYKCEKVISKHIYPLIQLSISELLNVTIPSETETIVKVKQEINVDNGGVLETDLKHNNLDYLQEHEIGQEDACFDKTYLETEAGRPVLLGIAEKDTYSTLDKFYSNSKDILNSLKSYSCDTCKKTYSKKYSLIMHIKTHSDEKPYKCNRCHKIFSQNTYLMKHIRKHTNEKLYSCDMCNKRFSRNSDLTRHIRTHTGDKPYSCDMCKKSFSQYGNLMTHIRTHTGEKPYSCDVCNKTFSVGSSLIRHNRTHTGDKPYSCDVCNKTFSDGSSLIRHNRTHTGDKPYSSSLGY